MNGENIEDGQAYEVYTSQKELEKIQKEFSDEMVVNSLIKKVENGNSSAQPILIDTSSLSREKLQDCIDISKEIERQEQLNKSHRRLNNPTTLEATMTHEEVFECSFENDRFLMALEDENLFGPPQITDLDASQSSENAMQYLDENVNADSGPSRGATPTKLLCTSTVAAAITNLKTQMSKSFGSPPPPYQDLVSPKSCCKNTEPEVPTSITKELRKKYEQYVVEKQKPQEKAHKSKDQRKSAPPVLPTTTSKSQKSPNLPRKSKVEQLAQMFNSKISQLMCHDSTEKKDSKSSFEQLSKKPVMMKPVPKLRSSLPTYHCSLPSPVPSPRFKRKPPKSMSPQSSSDSESACIVAEDVFRQLCVKDKVLLYNKFIEDMSKQHPQFCVYTRVVEATVLNELARTGKAVKSSKVKEIARELESKLKIPKPRISAWALKPIQPEYDAANRRTSPTSTPVTAITRLQKANEANSVDIESVKQLRTSKLTVVLKPSPERDGVLPKQRVPPRPLPRKIREQRFINDMKSIERSQKRCNDTVSSMSFDTYGPPRKIHRTRTERFQPKAIFRNLQMERMFYDWIMEKYGVIFDITTVENSEDSFTNADEANTSKGLVKSKSKVCMLFGKAMAKLESIESRVMRRASIGGKKIDKALKIINDTREQQDISKGVIEVELPISQISTSIDEIIPQESSKRVQRKVKRQASQPPTSINKTREQKDTNKSLIEVDLPISQIGTSFDEKIPQESSKRGQRKVKRQAPQPPTSINETRDTNKGLIEVDLPISQISTSFDEIIPQESSKRVQRKVKRQAPQAPTSINETQEQKDTNKSLVEADLPISQIGTSIDEKIPQEPSKRVQRKVKRQAPQPPTAIIETREQQDTNEVVEIELLNNTTVTSSDKNSEADNESESTSSSKIKSDVPQTKQTASPENKTLDPELSKLNNQLPKKKLRRSLTWKKDNCTIESQSFTSSADSDEVINVNIDQDTKKSPMGNQKIYNDINEMAKFAKKTFELEQQKAKQIETILNNMNLPKMFKGGYKPKALSTPSPYTGSPSPPAESNPEMVGKSDMCQKYLPSPSNLQEQLKTKATPDKSLNLKITATKQLSKGITPPEGTLQNPIDSLSHLGFETVSNYRKSPYCTVAPVIVPKKIKSVSPLFVKLTPELDKSRQQNPFSFSSTPDKGVQNLPLHIFSSNTARRIQQQSISPIVAVNGGCRRLSHADDSLQNSPAMQVICEDRPLEQVEPSKTPNSPIVTESSFLATTFNLNITNNTEQQDKSSKFWVCAVDITISLDIFYNSPDRLCLLHEIFSQKSYESHDLNFGIDDHKFSIRNSIEKTDISARLPAVKGCSHYWFSTGELAVPFKGKCLASERVRRLFNFIKDSMTDNMRLRFGVDDYEFSRVPENKENSNRFSMGSGYSILAGPYANSNGVEKCSRATSGYVSANSNYLKTSKLNFSGNYSNVDSKNIRHTPESPCGTNYYDVVSENSRDVSWSRNSNATANDSFHNEKFDIETLEKLFEDDAKSFDVKKDEPNLTLTISEVIKNLQKINIDLKDLEKRMKIYSNHSGIAGAIIPHSKESPLYMKKLRIITSAINSLVSEKGFTECSKEQLESFMFSLANYADICLESCNRHLINVLDALVHHHQEDVNKTNNELALTKVNDNELQKP